MKIQKKNDGGGRGWSGGARVGGGVRVDVYEELKFLGKFKKKNGGESGGGTDRRGGVGNGVGFRVDVNEELSFWEN